MNSVTQHGGICRAHGLRTHRSCAAELATPPPRALGIEARDCRRGARQGAPSPEKGRALRLRWRRGALRSEVAPLRGRGCGFSSRESAGECLGEKLVSSGHSLARLFRDGAGEQLRISGRAVADSGFWLRCGNRCWRRRVAPTCEPSAASSWRVPADFGSFMSSTKLILQTCLQFYGAALVAKCLARRFRAFVHRMLLGTGHALCAFSMSWRWGRARWHGCRCCRRCACKGVVVTLAIKFGCREVCLPGASGEDARVFGSWVVRTCSRGQADGRHRTYTCRYAEGGGGACGLDVGCSPQICGDAEGVPYPPGVPRPSSRLRPQGPQAVAPPPACRRSPGRMAGGGQRHDASPYGAAVTQSISTDTGGRAAEHSRVTHMWWAQSLCTLAAEGAQNARNTTISRHAALALHADDARGRGAMRATPRSAGVRLTHKLRAVAAHPRR